MKTLSSAIIGFFFFAAISLNGQGVTPISSSVNLTADANAGIGDTQTEQSVSQTTSLTPLYNTVSVQAHNGSLTASVESDATATWSSASAGQFSIHDTFTSSNLSAYFDARVATGGPAWIYTFNSALPATLNLDYVATYSGSNPYMIILFVNQMTGDVLNDNNLVKQVTPARPPTSGTVQFSLNPGVDYTFSIVDDSNINQNFNAFGLDMNAMFSFQITPVPEPSEFAFASMFIVAIFLSRKVRLRLIRT